MNIFRDFKSKIEKEFEALVAAGSLPAGLDFGRVTVEPPRDASHGDLSTNAALVLAKDAGLKPRDLADKLAERLKQLPDVTYVTVAGPGFLNWRLAESLWRSQLSGILAAGTGFASAPKKGKKVNVEYVSANPTGPMHVGHARGAVVGDALARLLEKAGFDVAREYYINDAGAQVDVLARSAHLRYREALGEDIGEIPAGLYPGDYLVPVGKALAAKYGDKLAKAPEAEWLADVRAFAIAAMLELIKADLLALGVNHAVFASERALVEAGKVEEAFKALEAKGLIYTGVLEPPKGKAPDDWEPRPQVLFRSSQYGDDTDRPLKKSDGSWTYFASDIAYHFDKFQRGFATQIDVWGADHGGYIKRMQAAVKAITEGQGELDVKICQLVNLLENGEPVKMSKRAGTFVTLRDVVDRVGKDVVRFIMLTRKNDAALDFDLAKVVEQSKENPVFYVQYAHARAHSVFRNAAEAFPGIATDAASLAKADLARLTDPDEIALIKLMATWPRIVDSAAEAHEPHRVAFYLQELAAGFHGLWNKGNSDIGARFIVTGDRGITEARMALLRGVTAVIASGLDVLGVAPLEEMR
ncbi:MAG TPA: arginine--tRNA ligase [Alphaproteobacteria bacterium]|jgi:arginyl-tRNA synthetase